ncbi:MAG: HAMP domain-containing histidine kinase [Myxococcota bacterium]|nr:HAMP domain-containing histidine kinase [Myxococcota bacterium]
MRVSRVWIYVLSAAALLVPAGGIAYLGAVSYRDDRGAVRALQERQQQAALAVADRLTRSIEEALDGVERAALFGAAPQTRGRPTVVDAALARHWFWIDADQQLRVPRGVPSVLELAGSVEKDCEGARLEVCMREDLTREERGARLHAAQRAETNQRFAEARTLYLKLVAFDDAGAAALIGLARVHAALGDAPKASQALADLEKRFADRSIDGVPVRVVAATLRAQVAGNDALLSLAEDVLGDKFAIDPIIRLGVLTRIRALVAGELGSDLARRRAELDERIVGLRREARAAAGLADELGEITRVAAPVWRGRTSSREPLRTLIYRRRADGGVIGISVDAPMLEEVAALENAAEIAANARTMILPAGGSPSPDLRSIVQVPLGTALPHLSLAIVNPMSDPDPLDEVIAKRSRRHVMYTSALALLLGLGLLATIRSALRARELAQLKSDFVSTVSHELKTPLTSIRMFAEMLEQGVAQGDPQKQARYQSVIVQESQRLGLLIANLLDYAQIERGTRRYTPSRQSIGQLAQHAVATFEILRDSERTGRNPVEVEVSSGAMHAEVDVDRDVVVQAVLNLVSNAVKYGGDMPIEVLVGADATAAWISVRDHGPGIPANEQARIFKEFYRAPEAYRSNIEGTGLGLALVKRHIETLGGAVEVESEVGKGSTFTIKLPRSAPEAA